MLAWGMEVRVRRKGERRAGRLTANGAYRLEINRVAGKELKSHHLVSVNVLGRENRLASCVNAIEGGKKGEN